MQDPGSDLTYLVFVYGTLKQGGKNHGFLKTSEFLCSAEVRGEFSLYLDRFPSLVREPSKALVVGEVYRVDDLTLVALDALEEVPHWYQREEILVQTQEEGPLKVWTYTLAKNRLSPKARPIATGIFDVSII